MENFKNKNYKLKLCSNYEKKGLCNYGDNCNFAHGKNDLRKKKCYNYENCWNEHCNFEHAENWNPKRNKICKYYINGFCKNENICNFNHITGEIENFEKTSYKKFDINSNDIFPPLLNEKNKIININQDEEDNDKFELIKKHDNKIKNMNEDISLNINFSLNGKELNENELNKFLNINRDNLQLGKNEEIDKINKENLGNNEYDSESSYLLNKNAKRNNVNSNEKEKKYLDKYEKIKIDEKKIYDKITNDKDLMHNYIKYKNSEDILDICGNNIEVMNKYLVEHINIIKDNFNEIMFKTDDTNFSNYCINAQLLLNNIKINAVSLKDNFNDYKYFLQNKRYN